LLPNSEHTKAKVLIDFYIEEYQGTMGMKISSGSNVLLDRVNFQESNFSFTTEVCLPGELTLEMYNKNPGDTEIDENNNIKRDKHIKIKRLAVDNMPVSSHTFYKLFKLTHSQGESHGPYFGFNGSCKIVFDTQNTFEWHLQVLAST
jgi:hypothetical protein